MAARLGIAAAGVPGTVDVFAQKLTQILAADFTAIAMQTPLDLSTPLWPLLASADAHGWPFRGPMSGIQQGLDAAAFHVCKRAACAYLLGSVPLHQAAVLVSVRCSCRAALDWATLGCMTCSPAHCRGIPSADAATRY